MTPRAQFTDETVLLAALRREAQRKDPAFSPWLHDRIMARVRAEDAPVLVARRNWRVGWWAAAAAACVIVAVGAWYAPRPVMPTREVVMPGGEETPVESLESLEAVQYIVRDTVDPATARLAEGKFAYLDHDAERLAQFVYNQVAVTPTEE